MSDRGNIEADLVLAEREVESALISARVAERAARVAAAALARIQRAIEERQVITATPVNVLPSHLVRGEAPTS